MNTTTCTGTMSETTDRTCQDVPDINVLDHAFDIDGGDSEWIAVKADETRQHCQRQYRLNAWCYRTPAVA